jgi:hypothetical protein
MGLLSREEGLDPLTKLGGAVLLKYIAGSQKDFKKMLGTIWTASNYFEHTLGTLLRGPDLASYEEMLELGVMKKKYIPYSAYMAAISAYPLLSRVASQKQLLSTILAKMALILSIKVLDNINDTFHTTEEAAESLDRQAAAVLNGAFIKRQATTSMNRAENSCLALAIIVNKWLNTSVQRSQVAKEIFFNDFKTYMEGQRASFIQQNILQRDGLTLCDYVKQVNKKGVGRIWVGLDLCMMEHLCEKNEKTYKSFQFLRRGFDYIFKSFNYYDDVGDLDADLAVGIWNSVVYLGREMGLLEKPEDAIRCEKLKKLTISLGDIHYLIGRYYIRYACEYLPVNKSSLFASLAVLRFFTARKWFLKSPSLSKFVTLLKIRVSDELQPYVTYIKNI